MSQTYFPVCAKFVPRPCAHPRFIAHLPKPGLFVRTSRGSSSSSARSRTASRATVDDLRAVAATEADSLYDLLGISESGTTSEIRQAYRQLVLKYNPDVSPPDRAKEYTKRFLQVQEAYETLYDPTGRALYYRDMAIGGTTRHCGVQASVGVSNQLMSYRGEARKKISAMRACPGELEFAGEDDHSIRQCRECNRPS